jgi:hypothetical protein
VQGVGNLPLLAAMPHGAFDLVVVAHRPGEQLARNPGIGKVASVAQRRREFGDGGDPVVDRAAGDVEEPRQFFGRCAQQAVVVGQFAIFRLVGGGASQGAHVSNLSQ